MANSILTLRVHKALGSNSPTASFDNAYKRSITILNMLGGKLDSFHMTYKLLFKARC